MKVFTGSEQEGQSESVSVIRRSRPLRVLFVCLGNICRSPAAEVIFLAAAAESLPPACVQADSCGTASYHTGEKPDHRMLAALKRAGYTYGGHRARTFCTADFRRFDLIIPQDESNRLDLLELAPDADAAARVVPMSRWFPADAGVTEVPDPYYGDSAGFDAVVRLLALTMRNLTADIAAER